MLFFIVKILISSLIIASASSLANRNTALAGFIVALPLVSILSLTFSWLGTRDMEKVNAFAVSIVSAVPLSLLFFVPFILNRWLKMNFPMTFAMAIGLLGAAYALHQFFLKWMGMAR